MSSVRLELFINYWLGVVCDKYVYMHICMYICIYVCVFMVVRLVLSAAFDIQRGSWDIPPMVKRDLLNKQPIWCFVLSSSEHVILATHL